MVEEGEGACGSEVVGGEWVVDLEVFLLLGFVGIGEVVRVESEWSGSPNGRGMDWNDEDGE